MKLLCLALILSSLFHLTSCQVKGGKSGNELISGHVPVENVFSVSVPSTGRYKTGDVLTFRLTHPFDLIVSGTPRLALTIGSDVVYANLASGNGTKVLTFTYTVKSGDMDDNGISVSKSLDLNGGSIKFHETDVTTTLSIPSTSGVKIDTSAPAVLGVVPPENGNYYSGHILIFKVLYNEPVKVTGTPSIDLTFNECVSGTETKKAQFSSGSGTNVLFFTYAVEKTCNETTGGMPVTTEIKLNGGTIKDLAGNTAGTDLSAFLTSPIASTTQVRGRYPLFTTVTPPAAGTYTPGSTLDFELNFDRNVTVSGTSAYFNIEIGTDSTKRAQYVSGSGSSKLKFRYTVVVGDNDTDGVKIAGNIVSETTICSSGFCLVNNVTDVLPLSTFSNVKVNAPVPVITGITLPAPLPSYYKLGDTVQVVVGFSEPVVVTGGTPLLTAVVGTTERSFSYLSGSGTANLIFNYTIQDTDVDTDGVNFSSPLVLNGATIQNSQGTNADLDFTYTLNANFRFDGEPPYIVSSVINSTVAVNHPDYRLGQFINIDVTFNENVTVSGSSIAITIGGISRTASYSSSVSSTVKRYRYTVQAGDHISNQAASLTVGTTVTGGTIRDTATNNIVNRTVPATNTAGVKIDGAVPTVTTVDLPTNGTFIYGQNLDFTVNFSEPVAVTGTPTWTVTLDNGGPKSLSYVSGSGTSALLFRMTVDNDDLDTNGIALANSFTLTGATITDASVGNSLTNSIPAQTTTGIKVDGVVPTVSNISGPASDTYIESTPLDFTVTYSEAVTITGNPQLVLNIGGETKYASYQSGSGSTNVVYRYTVETDLSDKDGVQVTSHILNGGTIKDASGNPATLTITTYSFGTVLVDSKAPEILSISAPTAGVKVSGNTLSFTVNFDEDVTVLGGTPSLSLDIGGVTVEANYVSGSGSTALVFSATLDENHFDPDGIAYSGNALSLNGASLRDSYNHNADLSFTPGSLSGIKVIYSEVISWIEVADSVIPNGGTISNLIDKSSSGNNAFANVGTVTKISSDPNLNNKASADFDGSSSLGMNSLNVKTMAIAFRSRSTPSQAKLMAENNTGIVLENQFDMSFGASAQYAINGGALSGATTSCIGCYNSNTTRVIVLNFDNPQSLEAILGEDFDGEIAEVWMLSGDQGLSDDQIEKIGIYLNSKY